MKRFSVFFAIILILALSYPALAQEPVIGEIRMWAGSAGSPPAGWAICDGFAANRTTYSALYTVVGDAYGSGDGSTTFNLPDFRGRGPMGYKQSDADFGARGYTGGAKTHTLAVGELPAHTHGLNGYVYTYLGGGGSHNWSISSGGNNLASIYSTSQSTGSGTPVAILDPYLTINFIIYTGVGGATATPTPTATATPTSTPTPTATPTGSVTPSATTTSTLYLPYVITTTLQSGTVLGVPEQVSFGQIITSGIVLSLIAALALDFLFRFVYRR